MGVVGVEGMMDVAVVGVNEVVARMRDDQVGVGVVESCHWLVVIGADLLNLTCHILYV